MKDATGLPLMPVQKLFFSKILVIYLSQTLINYCNSRKLDFFLYN